MSRARHLLSNEKCGSVIGNGEPGQWSWTIIVAAATVFVQVLEEWTWEVGVELLSGSGGPLFQRLETFAPESGLHRFVAYRLVVDLRGEEDIARFFEKLIEKTLTKVGGNR